MADIKDKKPYRYGISTEPKGITAIKNIVGGISEFASPPINTTSATMGLPEPTLTSEAATNKYKEILKAKPEAKGLPTEEYVPAPGGTTKPVGYPEEGKVYTEEDLGQPMTGGGFGYVPRGLPEPRASMEDYIKDTITKMQDRADKLALQIESGFAKGKRLTSATEELKSIQSSIPLLTAQLTEAGVGVRGKEAEISKAEAETEKLKKEAAGLPGTFAETKELAEAKTTGDVASLMSNVRAYQKELATIEGDNFTYSTPEAKAEAKRAVNERWKSIIPGYIVGEGGVTGLPEISEITAGGKKYRKTATGWQRWEE